jgi:hypothetical protein
MNPMRIPIYWLKLQILLPIIGTRGRNLVSDPTPPIPQPPAQRVNLADTMVKQ